MMTMEAEVISRECIRPSSPTPLHLKIHKLSLLDQYVPPIYIPVVIYYPNQDTNLSPTDIITQRLQLLKQSLSETLVRFYPLAGKMKDSLSIDCNDEGIYFVEALVQRPLDEFLNQPDLALINKFLPGEASWSATPTPGTHVAMIQVTTFSCGGIVIGVFVSHMIADGNALSSFLKSWAATARKNTEEAVPFPIFDNSTVFPPNDLFPREATMMATVIPFFKIGRSVTRRYVFDASAIATLKAKATSSSVQNPTRVEAVSALLSKCIMAVYRAKSDSNKPTLVNHAVNLRRRATPPFSEYCMGNFLWKATALFPNDKEAEVESLVTQLRGAITEVNNDFLKSLRSWCNFGLYEIDFGWGKPAWASCVGSTESNTVFMNMVILMDSNSRDGVEAWVNLGEEDMAILEVDKELLAYVTLDPSPLRQFN
ncbi:hypothetical protein Pint_09251 [Pistacia integerrima]|uniref:Uncharacterized protein n=1 Tax=Pistacia integerrima TaxID=434235 RepID=A0ACC0XY97_9ROSI|nr:hypothetical protein Pint_09251 [Pistacia integerrima]